MFWEDPGFYFAGRAVAFQDKVYLSANEPLFICSRHEYLFQVRYMEAGLWNDSALQQIRRGNFDLKAFYFEQQVMNVVNIFAYFSWSNVKVSDVKDYASAALEENGFNSRGALERGSPITGRSAGWAAALC